MKNLLRKYFTNLNEYELNLLNDNFRIILEELCRSFCISESILVRFLNRNEKSFIGLVSLIIPFYAKTFNNLMTLSDLFYNSLYTNKCIETKKRPKRNVESILSNNTSCLIKTIRVVSNKLYSNNKEVIPIFLETFKSEQIYKETRQKVEMNNISQPKGLYEGDIFNVIFNDLYINYICVEWLLVEYNEKPLIDILHENENTCFLPDIVVREAVKYLLLYFPEFNTISLSESNYKKIMLAENKHIWNAYIKEVLSVFNSSWYSMRSHRLDERVSRGDFYKIVKRFTNKFSPPNIIWDSLSVETQNYYRDKLKLLIQSNRFIKENLIDIVFETLIKKGCLSKLNLEENEISSPKSFFFLENKNKKSLKPNGFYTMNWVSQINFFNHFINHQIIFVTGGTGVGKSTQSPILILYSDIMIYYNNKSRVVCSVPRKNAVENNCKYMRNFLNLSKDNYSIQFQHKDDKLTPVLNNFPYEQYLHTLKIVTDEILKNSLLKNIYCVYKKKFVYNHILIDESHEHKINMDLILSILGNSMLKFNFHTKIFIISATMDEDDETYRQYFLDSKEENLYYKMWRGDSWFLDKRIHISPYNVPNNFKISEEYLDEDTSQYEEAEKIGVQKIIDISKTTREGTILMFSIGQREIESLVKEINDKTPDYVIAFPLYSVLPTSFKNSISSSILSDWGYDKQYVMQILSDFSQNWDSDNLPFPKKTYSRYVIIGTNIVEASLTIDSLKYVIETGYEKVSIYNKEKAEEEIGVMQISESSRVQRRGRVGRVSDGFVFYMYQKDSRKTNTIQKEFQNNDISSYLFDIIGFDKVTNFENISSYLEYFEISTNGLFIKRKPENKIVVPTNDVFLDGFMIEEVFHKKFFIVKPQINVELFYRFHQSHEYWKYFFNKDYIDNIKKMQKIISFKYLSIYEAFVLVLMVKNEVDIRTLLLFMQNELEITTWDISQVFYFRHLDLSKSIPKDLTDEINAFLGLAHSRFKYIYCSYPPRDLLKNRYKENVGN